MPLAVPMGRSTARTRFGRFGETMTTEGGLGTRLRARWQRRYVRPWDRMKIRDAWFDAHFNHAAPVVIEWLSAELDLERARIVDFGCGDGITDLGVALRAEPQEVVGVDITRAFEHLEGLANDQLGLKKLPSRLEFMQVEAGRALPLSSVDAVFSWSVFEHVQREHLPGIVADLHRMLRSGGFAFVQIEPLYYSAFGSHLQRVLDVPWAHLLLEDAELDRRVMEFAGDLPEDQRDLAANQGLTDEFKRWLLGEYRLLNRITADELIELFEKGGFSVARQHRGQRPEPPPHELAARHGRDVLVTNEVMLLLQRQ